MRGGGLAGRRIGCPEFSLGRQRETRSPVNRVRAVKGKLNPFTVYTTGSAVSNLAVLGP